MRVRFRRNPCRVRLHRSFTIMAVTNRVNDTFLIAPITISQVPVMPQFIFFMTFIISDGFLIDCFWPGLVESTLPGNVEKLPCALYKLAGTLYVSIGIRAN
jgi:hypothetical protein